MIYNNIKDICNKKGMSISELERQAGLKSGTVAKWKTHNPQVNNLQAVAKALKVKIGKLLQD